MFPGNEEVMRDPGMCQVSCRHTSALSNRLKNTCSLVRCGVWLQILMVIVLADQASNHTSAARSTLLNHSTVAPTSAYYFTDITIEVTGQKTNESEIIEWLAQVFQNKLESCLFSNPGEKTAAPTTSLTTTASTANVTAQVTTVQPIYNITTTSETTPLQHFNYTTEPKWNYTPTDGISTTKATNTSATTFKGNYTTAAASTTIKANNTTKAAIMTLKRNYTTAAASTSLTGSSTTKAATNDMNLTATAQNYSRTGSSINSNNTETFPSSNLSRKKRGSREVDANVKQSSNVTQTSLFQGMEVSCSVRTAIRNTKCAVTLRLNQTVPPCCILRTLCAASKNSTNIFAVGNKADRLRMLEHECNINPEEENSCTYSGPLGANCEDSGAAYVVSQNNSSVCSAKNCSCSTFCNQSDAYYAFSISIQDPQMNLSRVSSVISLLKTPPACSSTENVTCPLSIIASEYKDANLGCNGAEINLQSCRVILGFTHEVPICSVAAAVVNLFQSEEQIHYNGQMRRAAICGNVGLVDNPLDSQFIWVESILRPANFCAEEQEPNITQTCQNGTHVVVQLEEWCHAGGASTTISSNLTTIQPTSTTLSANVTLLTAATKTTPQNTTGALNVTTSASAATVSATINKTLATTIKPVSGIPSETTTTNATSALGQAYALLDMTRDTSKLTAEQIDELVSELENLLLGPTISLALGNTSIYIVSNLLGASPGKLTKSSNRIIGIVDTVGLKLVMGEITENLLSPDVALSIKPVDGTNFQETIFSISSSSNVQVRGNPRMRRSVRDPSIPQGSVRLPPSLTQGLIPEEQQLASRVQFNFYQRSTVFQDQSMGDRRLISGILAASVANLTIKGLQDNVTINLRNTETIPANSVPVCVFWDFTSNNGSGGWNSNGCTVLNSTDNETVCSCNHLTSFGILLDISREFEISPVQATILSFITYIGCGVSAIFLSVTLLTYLAFGKLRKDIPSKILIQLCLALLLLNLVFLVDAWLALYPEAVGLCISTAWFLHYFLLVSFTWMGLEGFHMYLALVKVFTSYVSRYMLKFSLVGWGIPMIVVIIVIAIDKDNYGLVSYGKFTNTTSDNFCWLKNDIAFYVAVVAYYCLIFLFNFIMFILVLVQLYRIKRQNPHNVQHRTTLQDVRSVIGITVLLGLTWGFAFFAWEPVNLAFMYLFAIFNSLQGKCEKALEHLPVLWKNETAGKL
ncbi:adhesion G-protein coupled receptor G2 isoform X2 [Cololabis saira]|uniref:adhesion G-protein coupled receptor G2 isoform X2 n=1 Tax=Cololabis saira TaxID=129043 RepID=UPI002AD3929D|nr:adhesion G-protein coupled receptor G2 isoform X2 [Cololabis saira]